MNASLRFVVLPAAWLLALAPESLPGQEAAGGTRLAVQGTHFTLNGRPTFLLGVSYYGALGADDETIGRDLDAIERRGFNRRPPTAGPSRTS